MCRWVQFVGVIPFILLATSVFCSGQSYSTKAPDGSPAATIADTCVSSQFFSFTYSLPQGISLQDLSSEPNGGSDPTGKNFVLFKAYRDRDGKRDVIDAAAEDRRSSSDPSAASWMRALYRWNSKRTDVPYQGNVNSITIGRQQFSTLLFQQTRDDGVITYEAAYAIEIHGYVVYFIFGSVDQAILVSIERSIESFSPNGGACTVGKQH